MIARARCLALRDEELMKGGDGDIGQWLTMAIVRDLLACKREDNGRLGATKARSTPHHTLRRTRHGYSARNASDASPELSPFDPPALPSLTESEIARKHLHANILNMLAAQQLQANLDNAVLLAQLAARHGGKLADHFAELERRYRAVLLEPPPKPTLQVVQGRAA